MVIDPSKSNFFCQIVELLDKHGVEITGRGRLPHINGQTETAKKKATGEIRKYCEVYTINSYRMA